MPEETQPTPEGAPPTSPNVDAEVKRLNAELEKAARSYSGLQGTLKKVQGERDEFKQKLDETATDYETKKAELTQERDRLATEAEQIKQQHTQLQTQSLSMAEEVEALRMVMGDFPDLAPLFAKGILRTSGLKGDELKAFLKQSQDALGQIGINLNVRRNDGTSPPAPNQDPVAGMTLLEIADAKMNALRTKGASSKEYTQYSRLEEDMIRLNKHK